MDAQERNDTGQQPEVNQQAATPQTTPETGVTPDNTTNAAPTAPGDKAAAAPQTTQAWWDQTDFPEKEFLSLNGDRLSLKPTAYFAERQIAVLQPHTASQTLEELRAKFNEATQRVQKLEQDWQAAEETLKLQSRVRSLRDFLTHQQGAGNFVPLFEKLTAWETEIKNKLGANTEERAALVAQAEALTDSTQWKETTQTFRELEEKWRQAPAIDKAESESLRQRLDAAKDKFFERRRQHQEEVEKDMAQSLDLKLEIVEKAERLAKSEEWKVTTEAFRELLEQWKQTGKTFSDKQEALWQRFQDARTAFHERKRLHHQDIQSEQEENYDKKLALVAQAESLQDRTNWAATAREFEKIQQEWNKIGRVPQEKSEELWQRLHKAKDTFYGNRRQHNEQLMGQLQENMTKKQALIRRAEEISTSTNWREATEEMNELMTQWKKIGPAPREQNEKVWEQFLAARKKFFERKDANREQHKARISQQHDRRLQQTKNFYHTLQQELKEEEDNLTDFRESLSKLTSGPKEEELRRHLTNLITQSEKNIERRKRKMAEVAEQLKTLESRPEQSQERKPARGAATAPAQEPDKKPAAATEAGSTVPSAEATASATDAPVPPADDADSTATTPNTGEMDNSAPVLETGEEKKAVSDTTANDSDATPSEAGAV